MLETIGCCVNQNWFYNRRMERDDLDTRVREIAALDQPLRRDLYALLVERDDWVGRDEAADALDVPRSVAAFHLDKLADAGIVAVRYERPPGRGGPGAGRPAKQYRRSGHEVAVSLPDRRYDLAGALLADAVAESASSGRPVERTLASAARRTGRELGASARTALPANASLAKTRAATMASLDQLGYEPREVDGDIVLANCPFHVLADRQRDLVCGMNLDLLTGLAHGLGADERFVARLEPTEGMCCVRLRPR